MHLSPHAADASITRPGLRIRSANAGDGRCYHAPMFTYAFTYRGRDLAVRQSAEGELALMLGKVVRKTCPPCDCEPQYLWTNVELEWEAHHYIEAWYWAADGRLRVTANGRTLHDGAAGTGKVVPPGKARIPHPPAAKERSRAIPNSRPA